MVGHIFSQHFNIERTSPPKPPRVSKIKKCLCPRKWKRKQLPSRPSQTGLDKWFNRQRSKVKVTAITILLSLNSSPSGNTYTDYIFLLSGPKSKSLHSVKQIQRQYSTIHVLILKRGADGMAPRCCWIEHVCEESMFQNLELLCSNVNIWSGAVHKPFDFVDIDLQVLLLHHLTTLSISHYTYHESLKTWVLNCSFTGATLWW